MIFFLLILIVITTNRLEFSSDNNFNCQYLDKKCTTAVNGIFVVLVVFSHYAQYANFGGVYDDAYLILREHLNQMVVATFMFYSGFGMNEAVRRKGSEYVRNVLRKIWKLLLRFDIAVLLFLIMNFCFNTKYPLMHTVLAFTSWTSIGNSNWYITAILMLYACMYISYSAGMRISDGRSARIIGVAGLAILTVACVYFQMKLGRPGYCYNTMILFAFGCFYSEFRLYIERVAMKNDILYFLSVLIVLGVYILTFFRRWKCGIEVYTIWAVSFMLIVLLITMKVRIYNNVLEWIGSHVFSIYVLQRIPMSLLDHYGYIGNHKYMSLIVAITSTIPLALIFEKATNNLIQSIEHLGLRKATND